MRRLFFAIWFLILPAISPAFAETAVDNNLAAVLKNSSAGKELKVIVRLNDSPAFNITRTKKLQRSLFVKKMRENSYYSQQSLKPFFKSNPVKKLSPLWHINGLALTAKADTIKKLALHPSVRSVTLDKTFDLPEPVYQSGFPSTWNISQINADILWSFGFTGSEVVVAVMDTGADPCNPHLLPSYRGGPNSWFDPTGTYSTPYDADGHGTQVLGIILGSNDIDTTIGIAPSARWIAAKIFDDSGHATFSDTHLAFQWLLDPDGDPNTNDAPHIVNCSWGLAENAGQCITEFQDDVRQLREAGIAAVFAAGNENVDPCFPSSTSPANYQESLSVGAVNSDSIITEYSSRGPSACDGSIFPKLVAPGDFIETCDLSFGGIIDQHAYVDGTSFAAPHVSAAFALLMQAFPDVNNLDIEVALIASAADLGEIGPDNTYGNGQIDLYAAYQLLASNYYSADFDHNCSVDLADLQILVGQWLNPDCSEQSPCRGDINSDYEIDFTDFSILASQYLFTSINCFE